MAKKMEDGSIVNPDGLTVSVPQSTQEDLASLRESLTDEIKAIATELPQLDIRVHPKVNENGQQEFETRTKRDGSEATGRALFVLSFNSPWSAGRTVIEGNSSSIRAALAPFLADPALAARVKATRLAAVNVKLAHARSVVRKLEAEAATLA